MLTGLGDVGAELIDHVDFVMFTGSTATGKKVAERAAQTLTPVGLELGGKDPMIVLRDADLEKAANAATYYSMQNGGQTCISVERVYVEEPVYDEFVRLVTEKVAALRQGVPTEPRQRGRRRRHVRQAVGDRGLARARTPWTRARTSPSAASRARAAGRFYEPTRAARRGPLDGVHDRGDLRPDAADHEGRRRRGGAAAGQRLPVRPRRPRCGPRTPTRGESIAARIEAGVANVNEHQVNYLALELPMGGWKASGLGSRHGADGIRKYARKQSSVVTALRAQARAVHVPVHQARLEAASAALLKLLHGRGKRP